jgi:DNA polymerase-3 subunit alpha
MEWEDVDRIMKFKLKDSEVDKYKKRFIKGALKSGMKVEDAASLFDKMCLYLFNKGHGVAYSLISVKQMYYKTFYTLEFWTVALKYADKTKRWQYISGAIKDGCLLMTPHVNGYMYDTISRLQGDKFIWQGLISLPNVGEKAAQAIEEEKYRGGKYFTEEEFLGRVPKRTVNKRVLEVLKTNGALEFDQKKYFSRVMQFNSIMKNKTYN